MQDTDLDDLFGQVRAGAAMPSTGLLARIEADALAEQTRRAAAVATPARPVRRRRWTDWIGEIGGRGVLAGLATVTLAGIWLGVAQPDSVSVLTESVSDAFATDTGGDEVELIPTLDSFVLEG